MASNGIPIRLSAALATSARQAALIENRSLTEQVEHWARLGQIVEESGVRATTVRQLKATSYDERLPAMLAYADSGEAANDAVELIRSRNAVRYGADDAHGITRFDRTGSRTVGRVVSGRFEPAPAKAAARRSRR
jgi:hypothetical protein